MDLSTTIKVPRHPGRRLRILVRDPAWVAKGVDCGKKGYEAAAWFWASKGKVLAGTIALSKVDLNLVAHECCHAAWFLAGSHADEERVCLLTGELTAKVWARLQELV
jgi:hypothetical protein